MKNEDTPETNEAIDINPDSGVQIVYADFCRRIEREREYYKRQLGLYRCQINNEGIESASSALDYPPMFTGDYLVANVQRCHGEAVDIRES